MEEKLYENASAKLYHMINCDEVDWEGFETYLRSLGSIINYKSTYEDTLLSNLYMNVGFQKKCDLLIKLTEVFIKCGYDLSANDNFNGAICLSALCWSSYDKYVLHTAEYLLDKGAKTDCTWDNGDGSVDESIDWKLAYWTLGPYDVANIFSAYKNMIDAYESGEDYHGIRDVTDCVGATVTKIELLDGAINKCSSRYSYEGDLVIWLDDMPLVADANAEYTVDPNRVRKATNKSDVTYLFPELVGKTFSGCIFLSPYKAELRFNGTAYLFERIDGKMTASKEVSPKKFSISSIKLCTAFKNHGTRTVTLTEGTDGRIPLSNQVLRVDKIVGWCTDSLDSGPCSWDKLPEGEEATLSAEIVFDTEIGSFLAYRTVDCKKENGELDEYETSYSFETINSKCDDDIVRFIFNNMLNVWLYEHSSEQ